MSVCLIERFSSRDSFNDEMLIDSCGLDVFRTS